MIENDIASILESDASLDLLLGAVAGNSKIYPVRAPQDAIGPYIVYTSNVGELDENIDEDIIQLTINGGELRSVTSAIRDRIKVLIDVQDEIVSSISNWLYYSKLSGSQSFMNQDTNEYIEVMIFNIKYRNKNC